MEKEAYQPREAETQGTKQEALSADKPESGPAPDIQAVREAIFQELQVPEIPLADTKETTPSKKGKLPTQLEAAMRKTDPSKSTAEAQESLVASQQKKEQAAAQEAERKSQIVASTAKNFFDKRWSQEISGETIDAMLKRNDIEPWSDQAAAFMVEWDRRQAEGVYDEAIARFDEGVSVARAEISRLEAEHKRGKTKAVKENAENALKVQEETLNKLETAKYNFVHGGSNESTTPAQEEDAINLPEGAEGSTVPFPETVDSDGAEQPEEAQVVEQDHEQGEELKLAKGMMLKLPDGRRVQILKRRFLRDQYYIKELDTKTKVDLSGEILRSGSEVTENGDQDLDEEERMAA